MTQTPNESRSQKRTGRTEREARELERMAKILQRESQRRTLEPHDSKLPVIDVDRIIEAVRQKTD